MDLVATIDTLLALPDLLNEEKERRGLTMRALNRESGITYRTLDRTSKGELPTARHAIDILRWIHASKNDLPVLVVAPDPTDEESQDEQ